MKTNNIFLLLSIHPQYITDPDGNKSMVVLSAAEFDSILDELDMIEDIRLYDEAKKEDTGKRISLEDYVKNRKERSA